MKHLCYMESRAGAGYGYKCRIHLIFMLRIQNTTKFIIFVVYFIFHGKLSLQGVIDHFIQTHTKYVLCTGELKIFQHCASYLLEIANHPLPEGRWSLKPPLGTKISNRPFIGITTLQRSSCRSFKLWWITLVSPTYRMSKATSSHISS